VIQTCSVSTVDERLQAALCYEISISSGWLHKKKKKEKKIKEKKRKEKKRKKKKEKETFDF